MYRMFVFYTNFMNLIFHSEPFQPPLKQVPVAYFRTYSYQPFFTIPQPSPLFPIPNVPRYISPMMKMLPQSSAQSLFHTSDSLYSTIIPTPTTTTPAPTTTPTTTSTTTTTTTTTTTPKPTTTVPPPIVSSQASLVSNDPQPPRLPPLYFNPPASLTSLPFANTRTGHIAPMTYQQSFNDPLLQQLLSNYLQTSNMPMQQVQYVPCVCPLSTYGMNMNIPTAPTLPTIPASPFPAMSYPVSQYPPTQYPTSQYPTSQYPSSLYPTQSYFPSSSSISSTSSSNYPTLPEVVANKRSDNYAILPMSGDEEQQLIEIELDPKPTDDHVI